MTLTELNELIRTTPWLSIYEEQQENTTSSYRLDRLDEDAIYSIANYIGSSPIGTVLRIETEYGIECDRIEKVGNNNWIGTFLVEGQNTRKIAESIFWIMKHLGSSCRLVKEEDYQYAYGYW